MLKDNTHFACHLWRSEHYVKSVSWYRGFSRYVPHAAKRGCWYSKLHFTDNKQEAIEYTRYEWQNIFAHSMYRELSPQNARLVQVKRNNNV